MIDQPTLTESTLSEPFQTQHPNDDACKRAEDTGGNRCAGNRCSSNPPDYRRRTLTQILDAINERICAISGAEPDTMDARLNTLFTELVNILLPE